MQILDMQMGKITSEKENRLIASLQSEEDVILQKNEKIKSKNLTKA